MNGILTGMRRNLNEIKQLEFRELAIHFSAGFSNKYNWSEKERGEILFDAFASGKADLRCGSATPSSTAERRYTS